MRDLTKRFADFRPLHLVCSDDFDDYETSLVSYDGSDSDSFVPDLTPGGSYALAGATGPLQLPLTQVPASPVFNTPSGYPLAPGAPATSGTIIPAPAGFNSMSLIDSLAKDAAAVTNNAIIENANPFNTAIITNQPIAVGPQEITPPKVSHTVLAIGLIVLAGLGGLAIARRK